MSKLKICKLCRKYTLEETCPECGKKTSDAHYKFVRVKPKSVNKQ